MKRYYAAYGSNLNVEQMALRCPQASAVGTAVIEDYELLFKGSRTGCLTIEPSVKNHVPVGIWEVTENDELALDRYEGYPFLYYKEEMILPVLLEDGKTEEKTVFVYIMDESRKLAAPSGFYVDTCMQGYRDFGFDSRILKEALERSNGNEKGNEKNLPKMRQRVHRIPRSFQKGQRH